MQGQLRGQPLQTTITTTCAHCGQPIQIEMDSQLNFRLVQVGADPLIFVPQVNFDRLEDPSIIDAF